MKTKPIEVGFILLMAVVGISLKILLNSEIGVAIAGTVTGLFVIGFIGWLVYAGRNRHENQDEEFRRIQKIPDLTRQHVLDVVCVFRTLNRKWEADRRNEEARCLLENLRTLYAHKDFDRIANAIATYLHLLGFRFAVVFENLKDGVAAHVAVRDYFGEVRISVSKGLEDHEDALLAVLCHEVCHQLLHFKGVKSESRQLDELMVDIACVYLGLGDVMMKGVESRCSHTRVKEDLVIMRSSSLRTGYALPSQLALAYDLTAKTAGVAIPDNPVELAGVSGAIFAHYRREMEKLGCSMSEIGVGIWAAARLATRMSMGPASGDLAIDAAMVGLERLGALIQGRRERGARTKESWVLAAEECRQSLFEVDRSLCNAVKLLLLCGADVMKDDRIAKLRQDAAKCRIRLGEMVKMIADRRARGDKDALAELQKLSVWSGNLKVRGRNFDMSIRAFAGGRIEVDKWSAIGCVKEVCGNCGTVLGFPTGKAAMDVRCPKCGYMFEYSTGVPLQTLSMVDVKSGRP